MSRLERRRGSGRTEPAGVSGAAERAGENGEGTGTVDTPETARFDPRPSRTGTALAGLVGLVAVVTQAAGGPAVAVGGVGLLALVLGLRLGAVRAVSIGAVGLFAGVLIAGAVGVPAEVLLVSAAASVVAWDVAAQAVSLGEQVGRAADTARAELVHAAGSALVATAAVAAAYVVFRVLPGGSMLALALLLFGAVLLATVLQG